MKSTNIQNQKPIDTTTECTDLLHSHYKLVLRDKYCRNCGKLLSILNN
jgi:hypothetical protein